MYDVWGGCVSLSIGYVYGFTKYFGFGFSMSGSFAVPYIRLFSGFGIMGSFMFGCLYSRKMAFLLDIGGGGLFINNLIVISALFLSCLALSKEYVPDNKIVYLRQPYYLIPVKYASEKASPYKFDIKVNIDPVNPGILTLTDYQALLKPDINFDAKIYRETKEHLTLMKIYTSLLFIARRRFSCLSINSLRS